MKLKSNPALMTDQSELEFNMNEEQKR